MWMLMAALLMAGGQAPAAETGAMGYWLGPTATVVHIAPCGDAVCAKIVKLPPNSPATTDIHNPDASQHGRPLCGVDIGTGFHEASPGKLEGGELYDPVSGKTYKGTMTSEGDKLKLRGYVGVSLFGRSQTWTRVAAVEACK